MTSATPIREASQTMLPHLEGLPRPFHIVGEANRRIQRPDIIAPIRPCHLLVPRPIGANCRIWDIGAEGADATECASEVSGAWGAVDVMAV